MKKSTRLWCAALLLACLTALSPLGAAGESRITGLSHIDRGYRRLEEDLSSLGAAIKRVRG